MNVALTVSVLIVITKWPFITVSIVVHIVVLFLNLILRFSEYTGWITKGDEDLKKIKSTIVVVILILGGWWGFNHTNDISQFTQKTMQFLNMKAVDLFSSQSSSSTTSKVKGAENYTGTPIEPIMNNINLSNKYRYRFDKDVPKAARKVFLDAVRVYNKTGIVKLQASGKASNTITFSMYHKKMPANQGNIELGIGGPKIITRTGITGTTSINQASAKLNGDYNAAFSDSVTIHELGHALGLDHSSSPKSIMYPVTQGRSRLSDADIAGLRQIYGKAS